MSRLKHILIVDDEPEVRAMLKEIVEGLGHKTEVAGDGDEALAKLTLKTDLVLLDLAMPGMDGCEVARHIRRNPEMKEIPIIMVTAHASREDRLRAVEAGANDFIAKPTDVVEIRVRVASLLKMKEAHDALKRHEKDLERKVREQVAELVRLRELKRFLPPQVAELVLRGEGQEFLRNHRRQITVMFTDIRGFTAFAELAEPEEVMSVLHEYQAAIGALLRVYGGTLGSFIGDGVMMFFNDPVEIPNPEEQAVRMALELRESFHKIGTVWLNQGYALGVGIGMSSGYATIGPVGIEDRIEYTVIGSVVNQAARLCSTAQAGQILVAQHLFSAVEQLVKTEPVGEYELKGFHRPVNVYNMIGLKDSQDGARHPY